MKRFVKDVTLKAVFLEMRPVTRGQKKGNHTDNWITPARRKNRDRPVSAAQCVKASDSEKGQIRKRVGSPHVTFNVNVRAVTYAL